MRIYFDFLCWGLRKLSFGVPDWCAYQLRNYQRNLVNSFFVAFFGTALASLLMAMVVLISCAIMETTKQHMIDAQFYMVYTMMTFMFANWLIGWFHEFIEEREDLINRLKR